MQNPDELNRTYNATPESVEQPITMLAVPKAWTRIMIVALVVMGMILALVAFMVYITYSTSRDNTDRILEQQKQICETRQKVGLDCAQPTPTP